MNYYNICTWAYTYVYTYILYVSASTQILLIVPSLLLIDCWRRWRSMSNIAIIFRKKVHIKTENKSES